MSRNFHTAPALDALLGLAAHYRLSGWSYEDAMARAEELMPAYGQALDEAWVTEFWSQVDADMARGHGPLADAQERLRVWAEKNSG